MDSCFVLPRWAASRAREHNRRICDVCLGLCVKGGELAAPGEGAVSSGPGNAAKWLVTAGPHELDNGSFGDIQKHAGYLVACVGVLCPFGQNGHAVRFLDRAEKT